MGIEKKIATKTIKENTVKLNMIFEEAMKKALNTPIPTKKGKKK